MQLKTLLEDVDYQLVQGNVEQEISALIYDSEKQHRELFLSASVVR